MAKRVSKRKQEKVLSPTELRRKMLVERKQREEQRAVLGVLVPVLVLLAAFLGYGAYAELWREPRAPIARVEGETINAGRFQERIGWERIQLINSLESLRSLALSTDPSFINNMAAQQRSGLAQSTVDQMIDEALIRQEAEARGITVTEREVRNHIISTTLASILLATPEPIDEEPLTPIDEELDEEGSDDAASEDDADDTAAGDEAEETASDEAEVEPADDPDASSEDGEAAEETVAEAEEAAGEGEPAEDPAEGDAMTGSEDEESAAESEDEMAEDEPAADESDAMDEEDADATGDTDDAETEDEDGESDEDETASLPDKPTDPDEVSDEDFDDAVENYLAGQFTTAGITRDDYFEIQRQAVYRQKLNRVLGEEIETTAPQMELDYLLFRDKATADAAAAALDAGQSWDEVVEEYGAPPEADAEDASADDASEDDAMEEDPDEADGESDEVDAAEDEAADDDEAIADEADDATADDETADADAAAGDETTDDEASADDAVLDEDAQDDADSDEATVDEAADDEAAEENSADDQTDEAESEADEEEAEATASPSPIPAPTAEPFAFENGERRWYSRQQAIQRLGLNEATADTVMGLETDATSAAIQGSRGFYVFRAVDQEESRQLEEGELDTLRSTAIDDWLEERRVTADIQRFAYEDKVPAEPDWFLNAYNQITGSNQAMPTLAMPEVVGTALPAPVEQEAPAPAGVEDASGDG